MSSHDFGPSLPPHMKRSQRNEHISKDSRGRYYSSEEGRYRESREKSSHDYRGRASQSEGRRRDKDQQHPRSRDRHSSAKLQQSSRSTYKRIHIETKRDISNQEMVNKPSKRSKSDRTYNTDTEESSDDNEEVRKWMKQGKVACSSEPSSSGTDDENLTSMKSDSKSQVNTHSESSYASRLSTADGSMIGPALPPHLVIQKTISTPNMEDSEHEVEEQTSKHCSKNSSSLHDLETNVQMGPALPPHLQKSHPCKTDDPLARIGPVLPPHLQEEENKSPEKSNIFCTLTKGYHEEEGTDAVDVDTLCSKPNQVLGPTLPPGFKTENENESSESCDEEVIGPLLPSEVMRSTKNLIVQTQLERNAAAVKEGMEGKEKDMVMSSKREEWMVELPPEGAVELGLGSRSFRLRGAPEKGADRSSWTDTPADKARKEEEARRRLELGMSSSDIEKKSVPRELSTRDQFMEKVVRKHSEKRSKESLLEAHQKKLKKEKKRKEASGLKQERRPFSREIDLKANAFDSAQKKAIFKKAQLLDSRFSSGESKFL